MIRPQPTGHDPAELIKERFLNVYVKMTEKYYLDACIWRDYFENRSDRFRPLGDWALTLIKKIIENEEIFVLSNHLFMELGKNYSQEELNKRLDFIPEALIQIVKVSIGQTREAINLSKKLNIPKNDALHAILARDNDAILVTRDKHFYELADVAIIKKPEDLI